MCSHHFRVGGTCLSSVLKALGSVSTVTGGGVISGTAKF